MSLYVSDEGWNIPKYYKMALSLVAGWSMMSFLIGAIELKFWGGQTVLDLLN